MDTTTLYAIALYSMVGNLLLSLPSFCILILGLFGFCYFELKSNMSTTDTDAILTYISKNGYFYGKSMDGSKIIPHNTAFICIYPFCFGYISSFDANNTTHKKINILIRQSLDNITVKKETTIKGEIILPKKKINVYEITGAAAWGVRIEKVTTYSKPKFIPHKQLIRKVIKQYKQCLEDSLIDTGYLGCLFYGKPGTGKSSIGYNIAIELDSDLIMNYDPTIKGLSIIKHLCNTSFDETKPIVIVINEFDKIVKNCYEDKLENKTEYFRDAWSKSSLNNLLDRLSMLKGIILICTSNEDIEWFEKNNYKSTIRDGRFHVRKQIDCINQFEVRELYNLGYSCEDNILKNIKKY